MNIDHHALRVQALGAHGYNHAVDSQLHSVLEYGETPHLVDFNIRLNPWVLSPSSSESVRTLVSLSMHAKSDTEVDCLVVFGQCTISELVYVCTYIRSFVLTARY